MVRGAFLAGVLVLVMVASAVSVPVLSPDDLELLRVKIWKMIQNSKEPDCDDCGTPLLAQLVRLSFHDCVGGCDGVVDLDFPANAGLKVPIDALQPVYLEYANKTGGELSRADFYALVGTLALYRGAANQECLPSGNLPAFPSVPFLLGRKDRSSTTEESTDFPNPHRGVKPTIEWAKRVFGFDKRFAVAIMGAHTLGRARRYNSGFENTWTSSPDVLDNSYYYDMTGSESKLGGWKQIAVEDPDADDDGVGVEKKKHHKKHHHKKATGKHFQWVHVSDNQGLMFDSDMCLYKDIKPETSGPDDGKVSCTYTEGDDECPDQHEQVGPVEPGEEFSMAELSNLYAIDNYKWMQDFSKAFTLMIQTGSPEGGLAEIPYLPPLSCRQRGSAAHGTQAVPREVNIDAPYLV